MINENMTAALTIEGPAPVSSAKPHSTSNMIGGAAHFFIVEPGTQLKMPMSKP